MDEQARATAARPWAIVVSMPAEIDENSASVSDELATAIARGPATVVLDFSHTVRCSAEAAQATIRAYLGAAACATGLRVVAPPGGALRGPGDPAGARLAAGYPTVEAALGRPAARPGQPATGLRSYPAAGRPAPS